MKNPGRYLILYLFLTFSLFALELNISPKKIHPGERVTLTITAKGKKVTFPKIKKIGTSPVLEESVSQNITLEGGKIFKTFSKSYIFEANRSFTLSAIPVVVDGKTLRTDPRKIEVQKEEPKGKKKFYFTLTADKTEAYVGEPIHITFTFRQKLDQKLAEANFNPPEFRDFWSKTNRKLPQQIEGDYIVYRITYTLTAKHPGKAKIESARMDVGIMRQKKMASYRFESVKWKSIYANPLTFTIKPLPEGVTLFGRYEMEASTDKNTTKANEPVHLTLHIKGEGNLDELEDLSPEISGATLYADKAKTIRRKDGLHFIQKFAILSDRNFTIPPLKLRYFDNGEKRVKTIMTHAIPVHVLSSSQTSGITSALTPQPKIQKEVIYAPQAKTAIILSLLAGFFTGAMLMWLIMRKRGEKRERKRAGYSLQEAIRKSRNDKELLSRLLPYSEKSPQIRQIIEELEENLYMGGRHKIDPKKIAKALPDLLNPPREEEILS
ncbi:MAG: hypothetical protein B6D59_05590 [Campylobacteraceae bacterium 4484_4]|nr:MAG: hypothetical protein B6D59_05590 [Campylobacteraceae bacterium 4484_4]